MSARWSSLGCAIVMLCLHALPLQAAAAGGPEAVVEQYFSALRAGDIAGLTATLSESLYNQRKVLLEENSRYADFLAEIYRDVTITVGEADISGGEARVPVELVHPGAEREEVVLILIRAADGTWRVDREQDR